ncbi:UNVERIFIED_CONTAM: hypothetical protein GTU68_016390 [Idotea baltica]|nr:hypothetical protein [Idotea baltica]
MRIGSHVDSIRAVTNRYLVTREDKSRQSFQKLASGLRVAQSSDDAGGLGISERMRSQIRSLDVASRNTMDGIQLAKTAEGALEEVGGTLGGMRELAMQAATGTLAPSDQATLDAQFQEMTEHLDFLGRAAEFNGKKLLDGSSTGVDVQTGTESGATTSVEFSEISAEALGLDGIDLSTTAGAAAALEALDDALATVHESGSELGATVNRLGSTHRQLQNSSVQISQAESRIRDVDVAMETAVLIKQQVHAKGSIALLSQGTLDAGRAKSLLG